eukprot:TRINITY_DN70089_c0_g1_i1.p2 TRINITY_DN70089_c0_g1~~TRINITY_DN70089_c0_g1_i1.p2  ORF type:complete len:254 (+),score=82.34 TRINITY_DN70089_c0_g1_i1:59-763(+)
MREVYCEAAGGRRLRYADSGGSGTAVVWIHGLSNSLEYWSGLLPALPRFRHICVDVAGHGQSGDLVPAGLADLAGDAAAVMRHAGVPRAFVVGHSMGGTVAQRLAVDAPELVLGLVLIATSSRVGRAARRGYEELAARSDAQGLKGVAAVQRAMAMHNLDRELRSVRHPALVICGDSDSLTPVRAGEMLRDALPNSRLAVFPGAGHDLARDDPRVAACVQQWLAEHAGGAAARL